MSESRRTLPRLPTSGPLGAFEVLAPLGAGGMASVYRVRERETGRELALKLMRDPQRNATRRDRFAREAQITAAFNHPGIVRVHGAGFVGDQGYLLCELVEGAQSLDVAAESLAPRARVELVRDASRALGHAHASGVVHRDVKPDNLLVGADGRVRVADFGLASALEVERLTRSGAVLGTPQFMAPEQVMAERGSMGPHTDVWALGVVLYKVLTGELPFAGESFVELAAQITTLEPDRPRERGVQIPLALEAIVLKALEKETARRYPDASAFAADLQRYLDGQQVQASGVRARLRRKARRVAVLVVPLSLGAAALAFALLWTPEPRPASRADAVPEVASVPSAAPVAEQDSAPTPIEVAREQADLEADLRAAEGVVPEMLMAQVRQGAPSAYMGLVTMYRNGDGGVEKDVPRSVRWLRRAAEGGHPSAQDALGKKLLEGSEWIPRNPGEGLRWLREAADAGEVSSWRKLGDAHFKGVGTPVDRARAIECYARAEEGGDPGARESLATILSTGTPEEQRRAVELLRIGHEQRRPLSGFFLGRMLVEGHGVDAPDPQGGLRVLERAYDKGSVDAALLMGELYEGRLGIHPFPQRTYRYFSRAVLMLRLEIDEGNDRALVRLAHLYWIGRGVPPDPDEARRLVDQYLRKKRNPGKKVVLLRNAMARDEPCEWPGWAAARILPAR